jgi:general secretion pathway protein D
MMRITRLISAFLVMTLAVQPALSARQSNLRQKKLLQLDPSSEKAVQKLLKKAPEAGTIEFNFENADLQNLLDYIAELYTISFLPDDVVKPMLQSGKGVSGNKISFRTERPMTKKEVWSLFTTFLDLTGLALAQSPQKGTYRITSSAAANKMPLPAYIGVDSSMLPHDDTRVRYVYFLKNASMDNIKPIVDQLRSPSSAFTAFVPLRAIILTDKAYNIKSLMQIVRELDKASPPEIMSIVKLKRTGAEDFKKLYEELTKGDDQRSMVAKMFGARRQTESFFFPENTRVIAEPRTNAIIVFGTQETVQRIEDFIRKVDRDITEVASPLYIYDLQNTDAVAMAGLLNKVTQFGIGTVAGQAGGVREGEKYFKPITFTPEKSGNRLIIRGDYEDYLKARELIAQLDVMQPQVAMEVLIVTVDLERDKKLGSQIRNKTPGTITKGLDFQTSGFEGNNVVVNQPPGSGLMSNLIGLATSAAQGATVLTLKNAVNGVWAIFDALQSYVNLSVVSNPFLVTSNKFKAEVKLGIKQRVTTSTVATGGTTLQGQGDLDAYVRVVITPQINSDGLILMSITVEDNEFITNPNGTLTTTRTIRSIDTKTIVADKEILVLGGIIKNTTTESLIGKVPILGDLPLVGWMFKYRASRAVRQNLLVFIAPQIIKPQLRGGIDPYTERKSKFSRMTLNATECIPDRHDPVYRWFFKGRQPNATKDLDDFMERKISFKGSKPVECYEPNKPKKAAAPAPEQPLYEACKPTDKTCLVTPEEQPISPAEAEAKLLAEASIADQEEHMTTPEELYNRSKSHADSTSPIKKGPAVATGLSDFFDKDRK